MTDFKLKICCMGAGYVGGPTMAVIAKQAPDVSDQNNQACMGEGMMTGWIFFVCLFIWLLDSGQVDCDWIV